MSEHAQHLCGVEHGRPPVTFLRVRTRLADPDFEPTDEEVMALSRAAFADVGERHRVALAKLHAEIAEARRQQRLALGKDPQGEILGSKS